MKKRFCLNAVVLLGGACIVSGCIMMPMGGGISDEASAGVKIHSLRASPQGLETRQMNIPRATFMKALEGSKGSTNIRVVPLAVSSAQGPASPEYRLFNIRPGSVGDVLGLMNADILVAAHDYVVQSPQQFYRYLQLLPREKGGRLEVRRDGKPILLEFSFID